MKICLICKKNNLRVYRRFRRFSVYYNTLHKFNDDTFQMCSDSISIHKFSDLNYGNMELNRVNKDKYGYHMECYRDLVSIKQKYVRTWRNAIYKSMLDVYIHPDIGENILENKLQGTGQRTFNQPSKKRVVKSRNKKKHVKNKRKRGAVKLRLNNLVKAKQGSSSGINVSHSSGIKPLVSDIAKLKVIPYTEKETHVNAQTCKEPGGLSLRQYRRLLARKQREEEAIQFAVLLMPENTGSLQQAPIVNLNTVISIYQINSAGESRTKTKVTDYTRNLCFGICNVRLMSKEEADEVHCTLLNEIYNDKEYTKLKKLRFCHKAGWIFVTSVSIITQRWLNEKIEEIEPFPNADLSLVTQSQCPKSIVAYIYVSRKETRPITKVFEQLKIDNEGLNTEYWRVFDEKELAKGGRVVTLHLDAGSVESLKKTDCRAALGRRVIDFNIKDGMKTKKKPVLHR